MHKQKNSGEIRSSLHLGAEAVCGNATEVNNFIYDEPVVLIVQSNGDGFRRFDDVVATEAVRDVGNTSKHIGIQLIGIGLMLNLKVEITIGGTGGFQEEIIFIFAG